MIFTDDAGVGGNTLKVKIVILISQQHVVGNFLKYLL